MRQVIIDLNEPMAFGKYKGTKVKDIIQKDPHYLKWMMRKTDHIFPCDTELFVDLYCKMIPLERDLTLYDCDATESDIY